MLVCLFTLSLSAISAHGASRTLNAPHNVKITVKNFNPVNQETDLQIITLFKHNPNTDKYVEGLNDFNDELGGLISNLRERGEFVGELGETLLFTPPTNAIKPKQVLLIGLGDEDSLSLEGFKIAGRVAAREAVRLKTQNLTFAPALLDQGHTKIDLGDVDAAIVEEMLLTYDTEKKLQNQKLLPAFDIQEWTIEAGAGNFDNAVNKVSKIVKETAVLISQRNQGPAMLGKQ